MNGDRVSGRRRRAVGAKDAAGEMDGKEKEQQQQQENDWWWGSSTADALDGDDVPESSDTCECNSEPGPTPRDLYATEFVGVNRMVFTVDGLLLRLHTIQWMNEDGQKSHIKNTYAMKQLDACSRRERERERELNKKKQKEKLWMDKSEP